MTDKKIMTYDTIISRLEKQIDKLEKELASKKQSLEVYKEASKKK